MKIEQITNKINSFFEAANSKVTKMIPAPAVLLLCAASARPGLSPLRSINNICAALEGLGIPTGDNPDGSPNLIVKAIYEIVKETDRAMCEDASVQGAGEIGSIVVASPYGPLTSILPNGMRGVIV